MDRPLVSVIIPALNEEAAIADAITSVARQDYGIENIEVIVVDSRSGDNTVAVARDALASAGFASARVETAPERLTPVSLNTGLSAASGSIIVRVDSRSRIQPTYVSTVVKLLEDPSIAVVGGSQVAVPRGHGSVPRGIARALNNRYGMGLAKYRRPGAESGPVDTVYLGAFRTSQLRTAGGWNRRFPTNQDFELNRRMSPLGDVWFERSLRTDYLPRASLAQLFRQYHRFGRWKAFYWRQTSDSPQPRQLVLLSLPVLGLGGVGALVSRYGRAGFGAASLGAGSMLLLIDHLGNASPASSFEKLVAAAASGSVGLGWVTGVIRESLVPALSVPDDPEPEQAPS